MEEGRDVVITLSEKPPAAAHPNHVCRVRIGRAGEFQVCRLEPELRAIGPVSKGFLIDVDPDEGHASELIRSTNHERNVPRGAQHLTPTGFDFLEFRDNHGGRSRRRDRLVG